MVRWCNTGSVLDVGRHCQKLRKLPWAGTRFGQSIDAVAGSLLDPRVCCQLPVPGASVASGQFQGLLYRATSEYWRVPFYIAHIAVFKTSGKGLRCPQVHLVTARKIADAAAEDFHHIAGHILQLHAATMVRPQYQIPIRVGEIKWPNGRRVIVNGRCKKLLPKNPPSASECDCHRDIIQGTVRARK